MQRNSGSNYNLQHHRKYYFAKKQLDLSWK